MKTERRHELQTNQLADSMSHWIDSVKPYTRTIAGLVIALAVLIVALVVVNHRSAAREATAWNEYFQSVGMLASADQQAAARDRLTELAKAEAGKPIAWWSLVVVADSELFEGSTTLFTDKLVGRDILHSAVEHYQEVLDGNSESALKERALYGLARARESLGELKLAREGYKELTTRWAGSVFAEAASKRAKDLERPETQEFYDWFAKQSIGKKMLDLPGQPGLKPSFDLKMLKDLPSDSGAGSGPKIVLPDGDAAPADSDTEAEGTDSDDSKTEDAGATDDSTPAGKQAK